MYVGTILSIAILVGFRYVTISGEILQVSELLKAGPFDESFALKFSLVFPSEF